MVFRTHAIQISMSQRLSLPYISQLSSLSPEKRATSALKKATIKIRIIPLNCSVCMDSSLLFEEVITYLVFIVQVLCRGCDRNLKSGTQCESCDRWYEL